MATQVSGVPRSHATRPQDGKAANGSSTPRKPYVRVVTDKRREQNRRAQKTYRDRLRKKLEVLEEQAAASTASLATLGNSADSLDEQCTDLEAVRSNETQISSGPRRVINLADAFAAAGDLPFAQGPLPSIQLQIRPESPTPSPQAERNLNWQDHVHDDYGDIDLHQIWQLPQSRNSSNKRHRPSDRATFQALMTMTPQRTPNGAYFPSSVSPVADPYVNHLRLVCEDNIEASLAIGLAIGITRTAYLNDHPSRFPGCYVALNTFPADGGYAPGSKVAVTVGYNFASKVLEMTPQLHDHFKSVKPPLQPTAAQMLNPHPSYLDCIVFPYFRDHAVQASADGILDHVELFTDLMHGGLVCWGGASGLTNRHGKSARAGKRQIHETVAWSARSWEAKRWFLKKWTWLVGTEEEEEARGDLDGIWRGSRWWWEMRGDEEDSDAEETCGSAGSLGSGCPSRVHEL